MKLKIQPLCVLYFLSIAVFSSIWTCVGAFFALLIHELAHLLAGYWLGEKAESVEFTPFGGVIRYPFGVNAMKGLRGLAIAGAGPLANYAMLWLLSMPWAERLPQPFLQQTLFMHAGMLFLNLLPVLPLDGGRMIFCMGYYVFPIAALAKALSLGGMVVGATLIAFGLYGAILWEKLNLSLLLVGGYLIVYAHQNRSALQLENLYALLQERQPDKKAPVSLKLYAAAPEAALLSFVDAIADSRAALFRIGGEWVNEERVIRALMQNPRAIAAETLEKADNFHENDGKCLQHQPL